LKERHLSQPQTDSDRLKVARLRNELEQAQGYFSTAEIELEQRNAEIRLLERRIRIRLGRLVDSLVALEEEIKVYEEELARRQSPMDVNSGYLPVEEQYRRIWETTPEPDADDLQTGSTGTHFDLTDEKQVKRLYRQLARRYHPDLAQDRDEIQYRTKKMAALNEAYASRSLTELAALASETQPGSMERTDHNRTTVEMIKALEKELAQVRRRTLLIQNEIQNLHNSSVVGLSLETKLAQQAGRDLLGEMAKNLKSTIKIKQTERDRLKARLEQTDR
jgi:hypothetical protein